ncbi:hypothetical protein BDV96DRAFT_605528 [Lophiotrema nucula]|uniref:Uncharacterized protein n=1 Tax=Lophiotrema nucula TaxID=690887 RepID=A0A6A5YNA5_9PLEO|nr:hypothetical protein BDV96DRAFT_605528 [Lophiotrema nucula]
MTARKLGVLLRSKIPRIPHLMKAYGERASEIAKAVSERENVNNLGIFSKQSGFDGTVIWAAATSGNEALAVQLLACMLARIWSGPEAVSIWSEIVEARKGELQQQGQDSFDFPAVAAMQANITREQLAEWDASSRSWLKTADTLKAREQTQLHLMINNLDVAVNEKPNTYERTRYQRGFPFMSLFHVVLGCLSRDWDTVGGLQTMCRYYRAVWNIVSRESSDQVKSWLFHLARAAQGSLDSQNEGRRTIQRLVDFGRRRCENFLSIGGGFASLDSQLLRLNYPNMYIQSLGRENGIDYLRQLAQDLSLGINVPREWIIVYGRTDNTSTYCTALPMANSLSRAESAMKTHCRWESHTLGEYVVSKETTYKAIDWDIILGSRLSAVPDFTVFPVYTSTREKSRNKRHQGEIQLEGTLEFESRFLELGDRTYRHEKVRFEFLFGDPRVAGLYYRRPIQERLPRVPTMIPVEDVLVSLESYETSNFMGLFGQVTKSDPWMKSMRALGAAAELYQSLEDATCSMNVTQFSLDALNWISSFRNSTEECWWGVPEMNMGTAFSCIAFFETGQLDLSLHPLHKVMGVSIDDSLYVASRLIVDPYEQPHEWMIQRVFGNVGRPGASLLIPPPELKTRKRQRDKWHLINHTDYDFEVEDSFKNTSLHLWLTEYRVPYTTEHSGSRDQQAFFQEAVVSIHDRSEWVADVDIMKALSSTTLRRPNIPDHRFQDLRISDECRSQRLEMSDMKVTSIDNWYEILDKPENLAVIRAKGNWLGRLGTAVLAIQLGNHVAVLPDHGVDMLPLSKKDIQKLMEKGVNMIIY